MSDSFWMRRALYFANYALVLNKLPVGAVLVYNNFEIGVGINYPFCAFGCFYHAEIVSLNQAGFYCSNYLFNNVTLYVTLEPCYLCMYCSFFSKVRRIVFATYNNYSYSFNNFRILKRNILIEGGLMQYEAKILLKKYFLNYRKF